MFYYCINYYIYDYDNEKVKDKIKSSITMIININLLKFIAIFIITFSLSILTGQFSLELFINTYLTSQLIIGYLFYFLLIISICIIFLS